MRIDVCLISSNDISREGMTLILEKDGFNVVHSWESIDELEPVKSSNDFITILDCGSSASQVDAVERARNTLPSSRLVVVSEQFDLKTVIDCFSAGVQGYIIKSGRSTRMLAALRLVALGEKVVPSDFIDTISESGVERPIGSDFDLEREEAKLSPRELDVLCCLMAGYSNKVIARKLDVCEATVKVHVKAILRKLHVHNRTQAALWANTHGINEMFPISDSALIVPKSEEVLA
ncbi:DNA-binding response regulator [Sphingorhabdus pulchriflava]|uniref:DNA-binding response regulator n=2 Tax=Sphingorhabdus pulchriflava TaxID=2292257 RepID=A0A371BI15_9SPHN|nr:DNA-binding response regulator [Sphingorhabdus pulchriflava]